MKPIWPCPCIQVSVAYHCCRVCTAWTAQCQICKHSANSNIKTHACCAQDKQVHETHHVAVASNHTVGSLDCSSLHCKFDNIKHHSVCSQIDFRTAYQQALLTHCDCNSCYGQCRLACEERCAALSPEIQSLEQDLNLLKQYREGDCVIDPTPGGRGQVLRAK